MTIPACIAARHILLHIIDFSALHVIVRLAFAEVRTGEVFQLLQLLKWQVFAAFVEEYVGIEWTRPSVCLLSECVSKETLIE